MRATRIPLDRCHPPRMYGLIFGLRCDTYAYTVLRCTLRHTGKVSQMPRADSTTFNSGGPGPFTEIPDQGRGFTLPAYQQEAAAAAAVQAGAASAAVRYRFIARTDPSAPSPPIDRKSVV